MPFVTIVAKFLETEPPLWNPDDGDGDPTYDPAYDPRVLLELAFANPTTGDYWDEWDNQAHNGISR